MTAFTAVALLAALPATAQQEAPAREQVREPASGSDSKIEEIVVRGSRQGAEDFSIADSVTSFNAADLQALGAQNIEDIAAFTPNLEIVSSGATTPSFFIRGVGLNDFNANATSSVAVYQDDVNQSAAGLQLGTIFDVEGVNVLRGPQGTGLARNSSAGAIKIYSRKPTGQFNGFLIGSGGNYSLQDYQGGVEAPLWKDILSARLAFRWSDRDGFVENGCGGLPFGRISQGQEPRYFGTPVAVCRMRFTTFPEERFTGGDREVPIGLPTETNDLHNWAARGTLRFEPGLDSSWLAGVQYSDRDERSRLGHAYGTAGLQFGTFDILNYKKPEVVEMQARKFLELAAPCNCDISLPANAPLRNQLIQRATAIVAERLARNLDDHPEKGYYDRVGPTENEIVNTYLRGEIALPYGIEMRTVTGYAGYDRLIDVDLDFSATLLAEVVQKDEVYQLSEDVSFEGDFGDLDPATWGLGGLFLYEDLDADQDISLRDDTAAFLISGRNYSQQIRSFAVYGEFARDLWDDFTLDGGVRWNWEAKELRMKVLVGRNYGLERDQRAALYFGPDETWQAPTGTLRLSYRLQEDTRLYWKYTRGWKAGHYNATAPPTSDPDGVSVADPETIDAFETGLIGSWFRGGFEADFSLFYYAYDNYQLFTIQTDFGTLPAFVVLNADNAEVYGAELDLVTRPWAGAFFEARGGWLESRFVDFVQRHIEQEGAGAPTQIREIDSTGFRLLNSPQFKVSATVEQAIPLGRFGTLIPRYDGVWTSEAFFDATEGRGIPSADGTFLVPEHTFAQKPYFLHNARISYVPPTQNPVISLWVRNIEDKAYRTLGADATEFLGTTLHFIGDPRTYGVDFVINF